MLDFVRSMFRSFSSMISNQKGVDVVEINDTTATDLDYSIPELWSVKVRLDAIKSAFWGSRFEGKQGSGMPIIINTDFAKGPGDVIHFQTMKRLKGAGVTGETVLTGSEQTLSLGQFDLTVDWLRNAVGFNKRATKRANFDAVMVAGTQLSDWMARATDDDLMSELVGPAGSEAVTTIRAGGKTADADLNSADVFNTTCVDRIKVAILRKGAIPFQVKTVNGATLK